MRVAGLLAVLAALVAMALIVWVPLAKTAFAQLQTPSAPVTAVHTCVPFSVTVTVAFTSAVPLIIRVVWFVNDPAAGTIMLGVLTAEVSTVNASVAAVLVLPAASVAVTERVCEP